VTSYFTQEFFSEAFSDSDLDLMCHDDQMLRCAEIANQKLKDLGFTRKKDLEALITGHMEAMKPLLAEWKKLK
jgi:hypothetical protein